MSARDPQSPYIIRTIEWQWRSPLQAILRFAGRSIDDVVRSPRAAAEVRTLWRAYREGERLAARQAEEEHIDTQLWWRAMGSPVECPVCGAMDPCACTRKKLTSRPERTWLPAGEPRF